MRRAVWTASWIYAPATLLLFSVTCWAQVNINVRDYGATGNGMQDDTASVRQAIAALPSSGGILYFPCGTYSISGSLDISTSYTHITGTPYCVTLKAIGNDNFVVLAVKGKGLGPPLKLVRNTSTNAFTLGNGGLAALGIRAGSYVVISDTAVPSNGPDSPLVSTQQVVKVVSVNGDTATIEGNFAQDFTLVSPYPSNQGCCPYVQKVEAPLTHVSITNLNFDGAVNNGSSMGAIELGFAVDSEIGFVTISNFLQTPGPTSAMLVDTVFLTNIHDITCNACGNGAGESLWFRRHTLSTIQNVTITNKANQSSFGLNLGWVNYSTISNVIVDGGGADGRPVKLLRANHNTFTNVTAKNGGHGKNGISVTDLSTYNIFIGCVALENNGTGIKMFGNFNAHNTFKNCTSKNNTSGQFGQGKDAFGHYGDNFTTIEGGSFCCERGHSNLIQINSDDFTMTNANVYDDQALAPHALVIRGAKSTIRGNNFSGFKRGSEVVFADMDR